ncbi:hypothetical protein [Fimbriiglobus ruber]|uniref:Transposase IS4-like domain-containing protein n=1 Tax=Fimbriiglobus ruber TaxID=1908690 RepID=A0A225DV58_9BACT|nr:hypothetical protein [Fimbriiglobus ruber]OWK41049.1 hypothetical protein FRUB_04941 [Fimbriiglobus ruber]
MPRSTQLYTWTERVATQFPDLPKHQAAAVAEWSFGMVLAHASALTAVAVALAAVLGQAVNTVRQRLRERYQPAGRKAGRGRTEFDPAIYCRPLIRWITTGWTEMRVVIALDVTNLGDRFHVRTAGIVYRGCAIPVAWAVLPADTKDPWNPHWERLLDRVSAGLGKGWTVLVLTDRGLESADLFRMITARQWHPLMRVKTVGSFRPSGWHAFRPLRSFAAREGTRFAATGTAYQTAPLECTLLACRVAGCADPWLLWTDLPVGAADPCWYAFRAWIEQGFQVIKRGGWQWQRTRITDPDWVARVWVVVAVATLWLVEVGGLAEFEPRPETVPAFRTTGRPRIHRLFRIGLGLILAGLLCGTVPTGRLEPEPWPDPVPIPALSEAEFMAQMTYP